MSNRRRPIGTVPPGRRSGKRTLDPVPDKRDNREHYREVVRERVEEIVETFALSPREREVFQFLLYGYMTDEIAGRLGVSARTVKFHQTNLLDKLDADSRLDLFRLFFWFE
ncbi:MAG: helix-turn-helix transcriptional regulator [Kofleriaceae bacterium]